MDGNRFDMLTRLLGGRVTRRGVPVLLAGLAAAPAAAEARDGNRGRTPRPAGPCGKGSRADNACTKNSECCTGYCKKGIGKKDGKGRCRCIKAKKACTAKQTCCGANVCIDGICMGKTPPPPPPPACVPTVTDSGDALENGTALVTAIAAAADGAIIQIAPGQYTADFVVEKSLTLLRCGTGEVVLTNLTARTGGTPETQGRTIRVTGSALATLTLIDMSVTRNSATAMGGGIYVDTGTTLVLLGSTAIRESKQGTGGGIWVADGQLFAGCDRTADPACTDSVMIGDSDPAKGNVADNDAGGILAAGTSVVLIRGNAQVAGNSCDDDGGGLKIDDTTSLTITDDAAVANNTALGQSSISATGGGIRADGDASLTLGGNARVSGNVASDSGGGVFFKASALTITGAAIITGNTSVNDGGGLVTDGGTITGATSSSVTGNTAGNCNNYWDDDAGACIIA